MIFICYYTAAVSSSRRGGRRCGPRELRVAGVEQWLLYPAQIDSTV